MSANEKNVQKGNAHLHAIEEEQYGIADEQHGIEDERHGIERESRSVQEESPNLDSPKIDGTMPHQISAPIFPEEARQDEHPFVNKYGVVIGDSQYESDESPLQNWSEQTDPAVMAGDEWVHPTNDIGWNTVENRELIENKQKPKAAPFMHPTEDASYDKD